MAIDGMFYPDEEDSRELAGDLWESWNYLNELSRGKDPLLSLIALRNKCDEGGNSESIEIQFATDKFVSEYNVPAQFLPEPRTYFVLKKYHEKVLANIRIRERKMLDFEISFGLSYLEELCLKCGEAPHELTRLLDVTQNPPKISRLFREWAEITTSEVLTYCELSGARESEAIAELYLEEIQEEIEQREKRLFIREDDSPRNFPQ